MSNWTNIIEMMTDAPKIKAKKGDRLRATQAELAKLGLVAGKDYTVLGGGPSISDIPARTSDFKEADTSKK